MGPAGSPTSRRRVIGLGLGGAAALYVAGSYRLAERRRSSMDRFELGSSGFYQQLGPGAAASETEHYASIADMATTATAVVLASVEDVVPTRRIGGEGRDALAMFGVVLRPVEVVRGAWSQTYRGHLTVEFIGGTEDSPDGVLEDLQESLPDHDALWFLRAKAEGAARSEAEMKKVGLRLTKDEQKMRAEDRSFHRIVCSQGLICQAVGQAGCPMVVDGSDPLVVEVRRFNRVSDVVAMLR